MPKGSNKQYFLFKEFCKLLNCPTYVFTRENFVSKTKICPICWFETGKILVKVNKLSHWLQLYKAYRKETVMVKNTRDRCNSRDLRTIVQRKFDLKAVGYAHSNQLLHNWIRHLDKLQTSIFLSLLFLRNEAAARAMEWQKVDRLQCLQVPCTLQSNLKGFTYKILLPLFYCMISRKKPFPTEQWFHHRITIGHIVLEMLQTIFQYCSSCIVPNTLIVKVSMHCSTYTLHESLCLNAQQLNAYWEWLDC